MKDKEIIKIIEDIKIAWVNIYDEAMIYDSDPLKALKASIAMDVCDEIKLNIKQI